MLNPYYNNNPLLKKHGLKEQFTRENVVELVRCNDDIIYFIKNYVHIISLDEGIIKFQLYDYQEEMINNFSEHRFNICLLSRQLGKTSTVAAFLLHSAIFNNNQTIAILANKSEKAQEILARIKMMFELLPTWMKPGIKKWNEKKVEFSNGSLLFSSATTPDSIRGYSINIVYLDEFSFVANDTEFYESTYPVISSGQKTKIIITSTPKGMNLFYKLWSDAEKGRNSFFPYKCLWYRHPERDENWKKETIKNTSEKQFLQEHDCHFLGSDDTLISGSCLERLVFQDPIVKQDHASIYDISVKDHSYVACVDVSEGVGRDFSTLVIIDVTEKPYRQVYVYRRNDINPYSFSDIIHSAARIYNNAFIVVEKNGIGKIVTDSLYNEFDYDNLLSSSIKNGNETVGYSFNDMGLAMTKTTKSLGCMVLKTLIEDNLFIINDWDTISELSSFVKDRTSYKAAPGKTDDLVMPLVSFAWLTSQDFFEEITDINMKTLISEKREKEKEENDMLFGYFSDGTEDLNIVNF